MFYSIMNNLKDFGQKLDLNNYLFGSQSPEKTLSDKFVLNLVFLLTTTNQNSF